MVDKSSKMTTISVRIQKNIAKQLDAVTKYTCVNKSDFLRACLEKLCEDNKLLIDYFDEIPEYVDFIRNELKSLPSEMLLIKNGSWKDIKESTIILLCDELWKTSTTIFTNWLNLIRSYNLKIAEEETLSDRSNGLLDVGDIAMLNAEKTSIMDSDDILNIIREDNWIDSAEVDRISLIYACRWAFESETAQKIIGEHLKAEKKSKSKEARLTIDAKGTLRRVGSTLILPVGIDEY